MSSINLDVNYYSLDDLKKLFTVTSDIPISSQELDVKISNIILNAKNKYTKEQVNNISNFFGFFAINSSFFLFINLFKNGIT